MYIFTSKAGSLDPLSIKNRESFSRMTSQFAQKRLKRRIKKHPLTSYFYYNGNDHTFFLLSHFFTLCLPQPSKPNNPFSNITTLI